MAPQERKYFHTMTVHQAEGPHVGAQFWVNICAMELTSNECLAEIRGVLNCRTNLKLVRSIQGSEAQTLVNCLDRILAQSCLDDKLWQRCLRLLSKVCRDHSLLPASYVLQQGLIRSGRVCYRGGYADISDGEYLGRPVAIKRLRMSEGESSVIFKQFCREIIGWKHLSHPNVHPLLGIVVSEELDCFRIITEWMPNGNVMQYARRHPNENRLQLLSDVASGVVYLHRLGIVHGDLKGANILVDNAGTARLADFGLMAMTDLSTVVLSKTAVSPGGTASWMSPELLDPCFGCDGRPTRESDCYALGMVIYEVLTGLRPFHHITGYAPLILAIMKGDRPRKPPGAESLGLSDALWDLVQSCWSESSSTRPTAQRLLDYFSSASRTWIPPPVYPVVVTRGYSTTDSDSSSFSIMSPAVTRDAGTVSSIGGSLVIIIVLFLFLST